MSEHDTPGLPGLGLEPEDLDGHTIDELSDYLDAGRQPADPSIDQSPGCRIALDALARLRALTPDLLAADIAAEPEPDEAWVQGILAGIALDARAGRRIPIRSTVPGADLGITEGAVRGLVRAAEEVVPGVLVGRCSLDGDVAEPGASLRVGVEVSVPYGQPIPDLVDRLRAEIAARLAAHTELEVAGIDISVRDVRQTSGATGEGR
ncbi:Asp23/Gls24 family envelope stress response protein [Microbacterium marinilacus]|uniref:Asp23/Gls24 family envelope stress response protein n=1 Tax=Microbacterium marinilacus TaxID=415209 RepID=A0ABP7BME0_9MICO|nr:Asp23/Gls24 family envelope stress response protein [Microbacterium marinilacus]MBY0690450.1 Asp23/Gls24 family envelope stress response protein [Microbacterium marinilacus]